MSQTRFDVLAGLSRQLDASVFGEEIGWFESVDGVLVAILMLDTDGEYSGILFGRDLSGRFRWIRQTSFEATRESALKQLQVIAAVVASESDGTHQQGDEGKPLALFTHVVADAKLHERFKILESSETYAGARAVVENLMTWIENQDGNFVQQFQSDGFDARIWEIYLFMMLRESGFRVENPDPAPDFLASAPGVTLFVEATTANPVQNGSAPARPQDGKDFDQYLKSFVVSRYSGPLLAKLNKRYWEHPRVAGHPLVLAIQDFHGELSMTYSGYALQVYLYGQAIEVKADGTQTPVAVKEHIWGTKVIPSGFFYQPDSENISAVMFNGAGTLSKFSRIGIGAGFGSPLVETIHAGRRLDPDSPSGHSEFTVAIQEGYEESWTDGLNIFHNPRALHPLDASLFPNAAHHYWDGDKFTMQFPRGLLETSVTLNISKKVSSAS